MTDGNELTDDPFDHVHRLLKREELDAALNELFDATKGQISASYRSDENHAWYLVGDIFFRRRNWTAAKEAFRKAIQDRSDDVEAHLALANAYLELQDFGGARDVLLTARGLNPTNSVVLFNLGNAYFDLGEYEKAKFFYASVTRELNDKLWKMAQKNYKLSVRRLPDLDE